MGKARSFRLTKENEARLKQLTDFLGLDNDNRTFNRVIEDYSAYLKYARLISALQELFQPKNQARIKGLRGR